MTELPEIFQSAAKIIFVVLITRTRGIGMAAGATLPPFLSEFVAEGTTGSHPTAIPDDSLTRQHRLTPKIVGSKHGIFQLQYTLHQFLMTLNWYAVP